MAHNASHTTLGVISLGLAVGVTWGLAAAVLAVVAGLFGWGTMLAVMLQNLYLGFAPTFVGAIAGAVWGFVNGFVVGAMIAWLYNRFLLTRQIHLHTHIHENQAGGHDH